MDNRSEPLFQGTSNQNSINLGLTTLCTMRCPNCSLSMNEVRSKGLGRHVDPVLIQRDAQLMQGLRRVHVTGGEPTMHPNFRSIIPLLREWFNCELLTIETNGFGYQKYRDLFRLFDRVFITHYVKDAIYPNSPDNSSIIEQAQQDLGEALIQEAPVIHERYHSLLIAGEDVQPCSKWHSPGLPAGWYEGRLYSCCVTYGIDRNLGIPVTLSWREDIQKQPMGCERCLFRGT